MQSLGAIGFCRRCFFWHSTAASETMLIAESKERTGTVSIDIGSKSALIAYTNAGAALFIAIDHRATVASAIVIVVRLNGLSERSAVVLGPFPCECAGPGRVGGSTTDEDHTKRYCCYVW